ncbi:MAG: carbohydrate binding family 9 domain-containing protein [Gammaproteobacteria bacterium]|nr:carbohydrate binding family 9 domain-containing protein [Gammaproteobacteria bacterium]
MHRKSWRLGVLAVFLSVAWQGAEAAAPPEKTFRIRLAETPPVIDGVLDDAVWTQIPAIDDFHQVDPVEFADPTERTEVRVTYDADFIYVGAQLYDSEPDKISAKQLIQGRTFFSDDRFEVILDTFHDERNNFLFQLNPNGIRREALTGNDYFIEDWDGIWLGDARINEQGWAVEMAIPFKTLSFDPNGDTWGINFWRMIARKREEVAWSSQERNTSSPYAGDVTGLQCQLGTVTGLDCTQVNQGKGLDIIPSGVVSWVNDRDADETDSDIEPSLDLFYKVGTGLTAALTVNTDFSATEVDDRQVNLTRFSLFFPEKRDFFLQDAGIFTFSDIEGNGQPFFSRTIGLGEEGEPVDIDVGGKITGRAGIWNIGALAVQQDTSTGDDSTNLFVARVAANIFNESTVGAIVTDGSPDGSDNSLVGADFNYRNSSFQGDKRLIGRLWYQQTDTPGLDGNDKAFGAIIEAPNDRIDWEVQLTEIQENFNPALGFVNRSDIRSYEHFFRYRTRPKSGRWRAINNWIFAELVEDLDGNIESRLIEYTPVELFSHGGDLYRFWLTDTHEVLAEPFEIFDGIIIPPGDYDFVQRRITIETGVQRPVSFEVSLSDGDFFDGTRLRTDFSIEWRPSAHFSFGLDHNRNDIELPGGRFISRLYRVRADVAFNSKWSLLNFLQFDNVSNQFGLNTRLRYIPEAGKEMFLVLNHGMVREPDDSFRSTLTEVIFKLGYTFRF